MTKAFDKGASPNISKSYDASGASLILTPPTGWKHIRLKTLMLPAAWAVPNHSFLRVSANDGASYYSASGDYYAADLNQSGVSVNGAGWVAGTYAILALGTATQSLPLTGETEIFAPPTASQRIRINTYCPNTDGGGNFFRTHYGPAAIINKFQIGIVNTTIAPGSWVHMEVVS